MVEAVEKRLVGEQLQVVGQIAPVPPRGERFGVDDALTVDVRGAGDLLHVVHAALLGPELAADQTGGAQRSDRVDGAAIPNRWPRTARLGGEQQAALAQHLVPHLVVVLDHEVAYEAGPVVEKAVAASCSGF